jgi:hypothetical protein
MHHEEIELNFDASCQQILGLESEILCKPRSTPTLGPVFVNLGPHHLPPKQILFPMFAKLNFQKKNQNVFEHLRLILALLNILKVLKMAKSSLF